MIRMFVLIAAIFLNSHAFSQENCCFEETLNFLKTETAKNPQLDFSGYISSWRQSCDSAQDCRFPIVLGGGLSCDQECALPVGSEQNKPVGFKLRLPVSPGEAGVAKFSREFHFETDSGVEWIEVNFVIYAICPRNAVPDGEDPCPLRYFQAQIEIKGDARAFCGASINLDDAFPFPVLMCAGVSRNDPSRRLGVSLHRIPLK